MPGTPRFLTLADVAEVLNTSVAQVYALVRRGDIPAIKIGGRGQWRVEVDPAGGLHPEDVRRRTRVRRPAPVRGERGAGRRAGLKRLGLKRLGLKRFGLADG